MPVITIKGHEFNVTMAKDSFSRRALQCKNNIISILGKLDVISDDIEVELEPIAIRKVQASVLWFMEGYRLYYSYQSAGRYIDNLYVVHKVIELEVMELIEGRKSFEDFLREFAEEKDIEQARKEARETLGVEHDVIDMDHIDKKFKDLARKHHPDMPEGDTEMFKRINNAHKILRRELK